MRRNLFQVIIFIMMLTMPAFAKDITPQAMQHYPVLTKEIPPSSNGMGKQLQGIDSVIENDVKRGFPGAVLLVAKDGKIIKETAYGWAKMYDQKQLLPEKKRQLMTVDTLFDIASNTKIYAAIFAFMRLTGEGKVRPDDLVSTYLPKFTSDGREKIRLCDLMDHTAGFSPEICFYKPQAGAFYSLNRDKTLKLLDTIPLSYPTGTKIQYSDTDYMILCAVIEKITKQRLDTYTENVIYRPLGLTHTLFNPLCKGFKPEDCAATEPCGNTRWGMVTFPGIRTGTLQGQVQDEKAWYSMKGVSGHAGLFSRAEDLAVLAQLILNKGGYGNYTLCSPHVIDDYMRPRNTRFALGWNVNCLQNQEWEFGSYASSQAIAHTGWTGTDIVIDPKYNLCIILLTNRIHEPNVPGQLNTFVTDDFKTVSYGDIISMVYKAVQ
ncbi:penicillin binding protein PBP4B [Megasphaera sueciensis]|uniref:penicillin binding protein PBP4B n=1 Tax=Megasphaera sueciensis TaxID=349094 RepID=UPI003CFD6480